MSSLILLQSLWKLWIRDWVSYRVIFVNIKKIVRYITHDSYAISVVPPFNRLWAQVNAVVLV